MALLSLHSLWLKIGVHAATEVCALPVNVPSTSSMIPSDSQSKATYLQLDNSLLNNNGDDDDDSDNDNNDYNDDDGGEHDDSEDDDDEDPQG